MQEEKKFLLVLSIITFFSFQVFQITRAEGFQLEDSNDIIRFAPDYEMTIKSYNLCQESEHWEKLRTPNLLLILIDWQLVTNRGCSDRYMDKSIIGTVKNNSEKGFSEVKIEFTVYDEESNQIAIVFGNFYDLKPGSIWKFEIPVTSDVGRAKFNGLYVPLSE